MTTPSQAAHAAQVQAPAASANGTAPGPGEADQDTGYVTKAELGLAVFGIVVGLAIAAMGADLATGGRLSRAVGLGGRGEAGDVHADAGP